ncbi:TenA family transcriptional regulator [Corallococcus exiguus]|uniref:Iron-containing redox enzyme family protein n=1 Tax=Corallococcus exiguus TaxID=83462 RepID=A0A7X5BQ38_9BACT|nr:iron-containing redox enzyme family protein [Corallococcus exiguus]NBC39225.1 iron-containing redox enzyme family protein [Corallococcus exiguus]TNV61002.1 iron-containing redox enzyme family protein [Corallococcus exiguus]
MSSPVAVSQGTAVEGFPVSSMRQEEVFRRYQPAALKRTPHPPWMETMLGALKPAWDAACAPTLFRETAEGRHPPLRAWQRFLERCFPIVENFPKYMGLSLAKTTYGVRPGDASIRRWLLQNLGVEARHAEWWIDWMQASGVDAHRAFETPLTPDVRALHQHLLAMCLGGSLAEGIAASNWAIEGVTGVWTRAVVEPFTAYARDGVRVDANALRWLRAHARYDDAHPDEALEIIKLSTDVTAGEPVRVEVAAHRSLMLLARVFESCCEA